MRNLLPCMACLLIAACSKPAPMELALPAQSYWVVTRTTTLPEGQPLSSCSPAIVTDASALQNYAGAITLEALSGVYAALGKASADGELELTLHGMPHRGRLNTETAFSLEHLSDNCHSVLDAVRYEGPGMCEAITPQDEAAIAQEISSVYQKSSLPEIASFFQKPETTLQWAAAAAITQAGTYTYTNEGWARTATAETWLTLQFPDGTFARIHKTGDLNYYHQAWVTGPTGWTVRVARLPDDESGFTPTTPIAVDTGFSFVYSVDGEWEVIERYKDLLLVAPHLRPLLVDKFSGLRVYERQRVTPWGRIIETNAELSAALDFPESQIVFQIEANQDGVKLMKNGEGKTWNAWERKAYCPLAGDQVLSQLPSIGATLGLCGELIPIDCLSPRYPPHFEQ